ncbi:hypothetical protein [Treponema saccharophilum]|uniref:hypothetical protein n=1 Tax=Treponema saccharophilum TaxID=165 RepID=UPI002B2B1DF0|nr:hypothetical protein TRSA_15180 [Treponema saccharophilum]
MRLHHQKNPQTKNPTSQKSNPRDKSPPRSRGCTASSAVEQPLHPAGKQVAQRMRLHHPKKSANKKTTSPKFHPRAKSHHGAAERSSSAVEQPLQPAGKQIAKRMRVHHQKNPQTKKTTSQNSIHATNPTTEPRMHRILGGRTAAPPRRKTSRATNAGSPPKKSTNKKNNITKIQSTRKIPPRSRGCTASSAAEQPLQPAGKQVAQRMQVHHQKIRKQKT